MAEPLRSPGGGGLPVTGELRVRAAAASDRGRIRDGNEDRVFVDVTRGIFAVVDGVGGHASGEVAATIAIDVIEQRLARALWSPEQRVREAIALANNEILTQATQLPQHSGMTCVLTVALLTERELTIGHVGDTRLYKIGPGGMQKLTHDHSPVGEREDAGELSEIEAMRHPRRNEVFRDVGSEFHEPGDDGFIELVQAPFDADCALLLCSDGLTDMVSASAIERVIRQHAGNPPQVAEALVLAANEAGGRDNVSVVYVEGEDFARTTTRPASAPSSLHEDLSSESVTGSLRRLMMARGTWLVTGLLAGLALGLLIAWTIASDEPVAVGPRTLHVGDGAGMQYRTITEALGAASPQDTVQIEPGDYQEAIVIPPGVQVLARIPGSVTLTPPTQEPETVAVTFSDGAGSRISGFRIVGTTQRPLSVGVRLLGDGTQIDDVTIEDHVAIGIDVVGPGAATVRASRLAAITGVPVRVGPMAKPRFERDLFVRDSDARASAVEMAADSAPEFKDNVFVGFPEVVKTDAARREQLLQQNLVVSLPAPASSSRRRAR